MAAFLNAAIVVLYLFSLDLRAYIFNKRIYNLFCISVIHNCISGKTSNSSNSSSVI